MDINLPNSSAGTDRENSQAAYQQLLAEGRKLLGLEVENVRLLLTEKLTLLLGRITLCAVCFVIAACVLIFASMGVSDLLLKSLQPWATYMIVAGFYLLLVVIVAVFRRPLIVDPIARYLSQVILDPRPRVQSESRPAGSNTPSQP